MLIGLCRDNSSQIKLAPGSQAGNGSASWGSGQKDAKGLRAVAHDEHIFILTRKAIHQFSPQANQQTVVERCKEAIGVGSNQVTGAQWDRDHLLTRAGDAKVIATVQIETIAASGSTSTDRKRFEAVLTRTGKDWKLGSLTAIPVNGG